MFQHLLTITGVKTGKNSQRVDNSNHSIDDEAITMATVAMTTSIIIFEKTRQTYLVRRHRTKLSSQTVRHPQKNFGPLDEPQKSTKPQFTEEEDSWVFTFQTNHVPLVPVHHHSQFSNKTEKLQN